MRILTRYVLREFLIPLFYCMSGFISIYVLFELFGSFSRLTSSNMSLLEMTEYFCAYLAPYFHYLAPAALMLATLYTMWNFCRHSELVAMRASGVSFIAIVKPLLSAAFAVAVFVAWVNESYVPAKAQWAAHLRSERFQTDDGDATKQNTDFFVFRGESGRRIWWVGKVADSGYRNLENVNLKFEDRNGELRRSVSASRARHFEGEWWFDDCRVQHYDAKGGETVSPTPELDEMKFRTFPELTEVPEEFSAFKRPWKYSSTAERFSRLGSDTELTAERRRDYTYDAWSKLMSPFACIVITLLAIPAGIASGRQSAFKGIVCALGLYFAFYAVDIVCMVLAKNGMLYPVIAALLPGVLFTGVGIRAFIKQL